MVVFFADGFLSDFSCFSDFFSLFSFSPPPTIRSTTFTAADGSRKFRDYPDFIPDSRRLAERLRQAMLAAAAEAPPAAITTEEVAALERLLAPGFAEQLRADELHGARPGAVSYTHLTLPTISTV